MDIVWQFSRSRQILSAFGRDIPCINQVRNNLGQGAFGRALHDPEGLGPNNDHVGGGAVVYTTPPDGSPGVPYMPQLFPSGRCEVTGVQSHLPTDGYLYPWYFSTDAKQQVEQWSLDNAGGYDHPTGIMVWDSAYGLHHAGDSITTLGCLNLWHGDPGYLDGMNWLYGQFQQTLASKSRVFLEVIE